MPISSSAHLALLPRLAGWDRDGMDPELRKSFDVALHGGTALALMVMRRGEIRKVLAGRDRRQAAMVLLSLLPPAVAGLAFEHRIETRLGRPRVTGWALILGGVAMLLADLNPGTERRDEAGPADGLALGLAQAAALVPGVSRSGATITVARRRGFSRRQSSRLSRTVALPVILGAVALKGTRLLRRRPPAAIRRQIATGFLASLLASAVADRLLETTREDRSLAPFAIYRIGLGLVILLREDDRPTVRPGRGVESGPMSDSPGDPR